MSLTVKIDPIDRDIALMLADHLEPEGRSRALATFAREQLAQAQDVNTRALGALPRHETFVDGRQGGAIESVRPDGTIVFEFALVADLLEWIGRQLVLASPVRSGLYSRSHILLADGVETSMPGPVPPADRYVFVNSQPYARKIEGDIGREPQSQQAPDGVYQAVAVIADSRFGNIAKVYYGYESLAALNVVAAKPKPGRERVSREEASALRQPAIIVRTV